MNLIELNTISTTRYPSGIELTYSNGNTLYLPYFSFVTVGVAADNWLENS